MCARRCPLPASGAHGTVARRAAADARRARPPRPRPRAPAVQRRRPDDPQAVGALLHSTRTRWAAGPAAPRPAGDGHGARRRRRRPGRRPRPRCPVGPAHRAPPYARGRVAVGRGRRTAADRRRVHAGRPGARPPGSPSTSPPPPRTSSAGAGPRACPTQRTPERARGAWTRSPTGPVYLPARPASEGQPHSSRRSTPPLAARPVEDQPIALRALADAAARAPAAPPDPDADALPQFPTAPAAEPAAPAGQHAAGTHPRRPPPPAVAGRAGHRPRRARAGARVGARPASTPLDPFALVDGSPARATSRGGSTAHRRRAAGGSRVGARLRGRPCGGRLVRAPARRLVDPAPSAPRRVRRGVGRGRTEPRRRAPVLAPSSGRARAGPGPREPSATRWCSGQGAPLL